MNFTPQPSRKIAVASRPFNCSPEQIFQEFPYVGQNCWVHTVIGYPLPARLEDRDPVTVIEAGNQRVVVRNRHRQEWDIPRINVDTGYSVFLDGQRVGEHHPKFAAFFRHALHELEAKRGRFTGSESDRQAQISKWRWNLERNGYDPDAPVRRCPSPQLHLLEVREGARGTQTDELVSVRYTYFINIARPGYIPIRSRMNHRAFPAVEMRNS